MCNQYGVCNISERLRNWFDRFINLGSKLEHCNLPDTSEKCNQVRYLLAKQGVDRSSQVKSRNASSHGLKIKDDDIMGM